ncbi:MAG: hypothetical protein M3Y35_11040 [Actinomycetota bacterium]|nr:hypothetical protein [Actinomycetota bacterium]
MTVVDVRLDVSGTVVDVELSVDLVATVRRSFVGALLDAVEEEEVGWLVTAWLLADGLTVGRLAFGRAGVTTVVLVAAGMVTVRSGKGSALDGELGVFESVGVVEVMGVGVGTVATAVEKARNDASCTEVDPSVAASQVPIEPGNVIRPADESVADSCHSGAALPDGQARTKMRTGSVPVTITCRSNAAPAAICSWIPAEPRMTWSLLLALLMDTSSFPPRLTPSKPRYADPSVCLRPSMPCSKPDSWLLNPGRLNVL